jgi:hypothetical protein
MNALVKPEPAVGQVWYVPGHLNIKIIKAVNKDDTFLCRDDSAWFHTSALEGAEYLGTLDELRARATDSDLLYTDNSAVVERLSAENERLRARYAKLVEAAKDVTTWWINPEKVLAEDGYMRTRDDVNISLAVLLAVVEGDAA